MFVRVSGGVVDKACDTVVRCKKYPTRMMYVPTSTTFDLAI